MIARRSTTALAPPLAPPLLALCVVLLALCAVLLAAAGCAERAGNTPDRGPIWPDLRLDARPRDGAGRDVRSDQRAELRAPDRGPLGDGRPDAPPPGAWTVFSAPTTADLHHAACVAGHLFVVGNKGTILHRGPPGGALQQQVATAATGPVTADLWTVSFADASFGVAAGQDPQIWQTKDLGQSAWTVAPQCSAFIFDTFYALHLHSPTAGFGAGIATGGQGAGYKTFGGGSWVCGPSTVAGQTYYDVFRLAQLGWIVGDTGGLIYRTADDGANWTTTPAGTSKVLRAVAFAAPGSGVAVGAGGTIVRSVDAQGVTWTALASPTTAELWDVTFWDSTRGWVVGAGGTILATVDGGQTWTPQSTGVTARLEGVCFTSALEGWAVGAGGVVLHTTSGGQ